MADTHIVRCPCIRQANKCCCDNSPRKDQTTLHQDRPLSVSDPRQPVNNQNEPACKKLTRPNVPSGRTQQYRQECCPCLPSKCCCYEQRGCLLYDKAPGNRSAMYFAQMICPLKQNLTNESILLCGNHDLNMKNCFLNDGSNSHEFEGLWSLNPFLASCSENSTRCQQYCTDKIREKCCDCLQIPHCGFSPELLERMCNLDQNIQPLKLVVDCCNNTCMSKTKLCSNNEIGGKSVLNVLPDWAKDILTREMSKNLTAYNRMSQLVDEQTPKDKISPRKCSTTVGYNAVSKNMMENKKDPSSILSFEYSTNIPINPCQETESPKMKMYKVIYYPDPNVKEIGKAFIEECSLDKRITKNDLNLKEMESSELCSTLIYSSKKAKDACNETKNIDIGNERRCCVPKCKSKNILEVEKEAQISELSCNANYFSQMSKNRCYAKESKCLQTSEIKCWDQNEQYPKKYPCNPPKSTIVYESSRNCIKKCKSDSKIECGTNYYMQGLGKCHSENMVELTEKGKKSVIPKTLICPTQCKNKCVNTERLEIINCTGSKNIKGTQTCEPVQVLKKCSSENIIKFINDKEPSALSSTIIYSSNKPTDCCSKKKSVGTQKCEIVTSTDFKNTKEPSCELRLECEFFIPDKGLKKSSSEKVLEFLKERECSKAPKIINNCDSKNKKESICVRKEPEFYDSIRRLSKSLSELVKEKDPVHRAGLCNRCKSLEIISQTSSRSFKKNNLNEKCVNLLDPKKLCDRSTHVDLLDVVEERNAIDLRSTVTCPTKKPPDSCLTIKSVGIQTSFLQLSLSKSKTGVDFKPMSCDEYVYPRQQCNRNTCKYLSKEVKNRKTSELSVVCTSEKTEEDRGCGNRSVSLQTSLIHLLKSSGMKGSNLKVKKNYKIRGPNEGCVRNPCNCQKDGFKEEKTRGLCKTVTRSTERKKNDQGYVCRTIGLQTSLIHISLPKNKKATDLKTKKINKYIDQKKCCDRNTCKYFSNEMYNRKKSKLSNTVICYAENHDNENPLVGIEISKMINHSVSKYTKLPKRQINNREDFELESEVTEKEPPEVSSTLIYSSNDPTVSSCWRNKTIGQQTSESIAKRNMTEVTKNHEPKQKYEKNISEYISHIVKEEKSSDICSTVFYSSNNVTGSSRRNESIGLRTSKIITYSISKNTKETDFGVWKNHGYTDQNEGSEKNIPLYATQFMKEMTASDLCSTIIFTSDSFKENRILEAETPEIINVTVSKNRIESDRKIREKRDSYYFKQRYMKNEQENIHKIVEESCSSELCSTVIYSSNKLNDSCIEYEAFGMNGSDIIRRGIKKKVKDLDNDVKMGNFTSNKAQNSLKTNIRRNTIEKTYQNYETNNDNRSDRNIIANDLDKTTYFIDTITSCKLILEELLQDVKNKIRPTTTKDYMLKDVSIEDRAKMIQTDRVSCNHGLVGTEDIIDDFRSGMSGSYHDQGSLTFNNVNGLFDTPRYRQRATFELFRQEDTVTVVERGSSAPHVNRTVSTTADLPVCQDCSLRLCEDTAKIWEII